MLIASRSEAEWDSTERSLMLALAEVERGECGQCGHPLSESTDPANEFRYKAPDPARCHACTSQYVKADAYKDVPHPRRCGSAPTCPTNCPTSSNG